MTDYYTNAYVENLKAERDRYRDLLDHYLSANDELITLAELLAANAIGESSTDVVD